jgi:hypothetical protein
MWVRVGEGEGWGRNNARIELLPHKQMHDKLMCTCAHNCNAPPQQ